MVVIEGVEMDDGVDDSSYNDPCPSCDREPCDCEPDFDRLDDLDGDGSGRGQPCIGADCVSGLFDHDRSECVTVETMEAQMERGGSK